MKLLIAFALLLGTSAVLAEFTGYLEGWEVYPTSDAEDRFGSAVAMSHSALVAVVGAIHRHLPTTDYDPDFPPTGDTALKDIPPDFGFDHAEGGVFILGRDSINENFTILCNTTELGIGPSQVYIPGSMDPIADHIGSCVATSVSGEIVVVGAQRYYENNRGVIFIFEYDDTIVGGCPYVLKATLDPEDYPGASLAEDQNFGSACAISGTGRELVVGSLNARDLTPPSPITGAVYFFYSSDQWTTVNFLERKISSPDVPPPPPVELNYGRAVDISFLGDRVAVTECSQLSGNPSKYGKLFVYEATVFPWTGATIFNQIFMDKKEHGSSAFGFSVSMSGDGKVVAVGEPAYDYTYEVYLNPSLQEEDIQGGRAYLYEHTSSGWTELLLNSVLDGCDIAPNPSCTSSCSECDIMHRENTEFGVSVHVAALGKAVLVGAQQAHRHPDPGPNDFGRVIVFRRDNGPWEQFDGLEHPLLMYTPSGSEPQFNIRFGADVSSDQDGYYLLVGSPLWDNPECQACKRDNMYQVREVVGIKREPQVVRLAPRAELCDENHGSVVIFHPNDDPEGGEVGGDPHFTGFKGGIYDVMGENGKVYNVFSFPGLTVNALFVSPPGDLSETYIGEVGVVTGESRTFLDTSGMAVFDPYRPVDEEKTHFDLGEGASAKFVGQELEVHKDGWVVTIIRRRTNRLGFEHLDLSLTFEGESMSEDLNSLPHGLLGQTARLPGPAYSKGSQGEGVIEGVVNDYEMDDIFSTDFKFALRG